MKTYLVVEALFLFFSLTLCMLGLANRSSDKTSHLYSAEGFSPLPNGLTSAGIFGGVLAFFSTGLIFQNGFDGLLLSLSLPAGLLIYNSLLASDESCFVAKTIPQFLGLRFGQTVRILALLISSICTYGLLLVGFSSCVGLISLFFSQSLFAASAITAVLVGFLVLPNGMRFALRMSGVLYSFFAISILGLLSYLAFNYYGYFLPQIGILSALQNVSLQEEALIERGDIDFGLFKPFLREFLTVDRWNWFLMSLSIIASLSVFPSLYQINASGRSFSEIRKSISWALLAIILPLTALPFAAAVIRLEIYRCALQSASVSDLPRWMTLSSERDILRIHGTSLSLINKVSTAINNGAQSFKNIEETMISFGEEQSQNWLRLDENVQIAIFDVAQKNSLTSSLSSEQVQKDFLKIILPLAAKAAGNFSKKVNYSSFSIDFHGLLLLLPELLPQSAFPRALTIISVLGAGIGFLASLMATLANMIVHDCHGLFPRLRSLSVSSLKVTRIFAFSVLTFTALLSSTVAIPCALLVVGCLSLLSVSLLPAVLLGKCGPQTNAVGCVAAIMVGIGAFLYYFLGTLVYSIPFYEMWFWLSNAGLEGHVEFGELKTVWLAAEGEAKASAFRDLYLLTSGGLWSSGLANWFGIAPASSAMIAIPLAIVTGFIISLLTQRFYFRRRKSF